MPSRSIAAIEALGSNPSRDAINDPQFDPRARSSSEKQRPNMKYPNIAEVIAADQEYVSF